VEQQSDLFDKWLWVSAIPFVVIIILVAVFGGGRSERSEQPAPAQQTEAAEASAEPSEPTTSPATTTAGAATVVDIPLSGEATSFLQGALKGGGRGELSVALAISSDGSITSFIPQGAKTGTPFGAEPLNNVIVKSPQSIAVLTYEGVLATVVCWPTSDGIYQCRRY
jgi:hypothetical protein